MLRHLESGTFVELPRAIISLVGHDRYLGRRYFSADSNRFVDQLSSNAVAATLWVHEQLCDFNTRLRITNTVRNRQAAEAY
jgi:hypothetical protein